MSPIARVKVAASHIDEREGERPILAAADAAMMATQDAVAVARSVAGMTASAQDAVSLAGDAALSAKLAAASVVAAAASAAAEIAVGAANAVRAEAATRALEVAASAVAALETIDAGLSDDIDTGAARRLAAAVAAAVAAEVVAQTKLTDEAAARVAHAVALAADAVALAAVAAAVVVETAVGSAETSAHDMASLSASTELASDIAVESTARVGAMVARQVASLRDAPMVAELQRAVESAELILHYQPMYSMTTGSVVGIEALLRWQHPTRGLLLPAEFLDVAEGPHLVTPVGDWVLNAAVSQAVAWQHSNGDIPLVMWVNVSCHQLGRRHVASLVSELLAKTGLAPASLGIEVTERQLAARAGDVAGDLMALHDLGVVLAVDDFGTGYASLDYLRRFAFDEIKIDKSFVSGVQDRTNAAVTASIIALARSLDLVAVAEGIETAAQYDRLQALGCAVGQGYFLQRPAPREIIEDALRNSSTPCHQAYKRGPSRAEQEQRRIEISGS